MIYLYFFSLLFLLLINNVYAAIKEKANKEDYYLVFVNNTYGEFSIYPKTKHDKRDDSQIFIESLIDEINELIIDNIDTYQHPERLDDLETTSKLRKRSNYDNNQPLFFISNSDYIYPISSIKNTVVLYTYLSKTVVKKIGKVNGVFDCISNSKHVFTKNSYYNEKSILNETQWSGMKIQENADFHLSLLSQGLYDKNVIGKYDNNFYYPASAGEDVNIIVIDTSFHFDIPEFTYTDERIATCAANIKDGIASTDDTDNFCGFDEDPHGEYTSDLVGGYIHGVAKRANIYGVSIYIDEDQYIDEKDILGAVQYTYENLIEPQNTIVSMSISTKLDGVDSYFYHLRDIINGIIEEGGIFVGSAGNSFNKLSMSYKKVIPCEFDNVICVGSFSSSSLDDVYSVPEYSNYGPSVDIYAPGNVKATIYNIDHIEDSENIGTSFSAPLVSGMIAVYMSDIRKKNNKAIFTPDTIREEFLLKNGNMEKIDSIRGIVPIANNNKHIVYSSNEIYHGCGVRAGNRECDDIEYNTTLLTTITPATTTTTTTTTTTMEPTPTDIKKESSISITSTDKL
ncbi:subtilisin-like protein [Anaeromyces robustus]|uniref:Subtilisin-like protein n=1 Tax=Anaeromyces robustus TaxID=1754192 RepID=A0A1Y1XH87_9FUNG|nr:subtilisin-like protein [Anaeromyces robustus]|eukprot:ORX85093.1 subtilisin-like protein [Anaeromyces robustus]